MLRPSARLPRLSASTLALFLECPRCFWLHVKEDLRRPQGPYPSLPGGIDAVLKAWMDSSRAQGELPPEIRGNVRGALYPDQAQLDRWRDALRGDLRARDVALGVEVLGAIDDLLVEEGRFTPLDFKTRGWAVKDDTHRHYEHQLDLYTWLFSRLGHRVSGRGLLLFFSPIAYVGKGQVQFRIEPVEVPTDVQRAQALIVRAVTVLRGPLPPRHAACSFCHFVEHGARRDE